MIVAQFSSLCLLLDNLHAISAESTPTHNNRKLCTNITFLNLLSYCEDACAYMLNDADNPLCIHIKSNNVQLKENFLYIRARATEV